MAESLRNHWVPLYCYPGWVYVLADNVMIWISVCKKDASNTHSPLIKGVFKVLPSIGHFFRCRSFFSLFWDGCRICSRQSSTFFDLLKKYQVSLIYFFSRMSSRIWFSFTLLLFYLVFRLLWKSSLFELFRLNNKQGWIFRRCRRTKEFMSSPVLSNHHRRKPSVSIGKWKGRGLFWAFIIATNPH